MCTEPLLLDNHNGCTAACHIRAFGKFVHEANQVRQFLEGQAIASVLLECPERELLKVAELVSDGLSCLNAGLGELVEPRGIEPLTFAMPLRRSPS